MTAESTDDGTGWVVPSGTRLVHIGPSKTGTTALQSAFWAARSDLRSQGVRYLGPMRHSVFAARSVARARAADYEDAPPSIVHWLGILRELRFAREPVSVFSSEYLAGAPRASIERVARDLDPARIQVVVTMRAPARILASRWQQSVQSGSSQTFEHWLKVVVGRRVDHATSRHWERHRYDRLVADWAAVVGPERVTAVVPDERDHDWLFRAFEGMLGLRTGTLHAVHDAENRSLTWPEVEAVRALNEAFDQAGVSPRTNRHLVHNGAARLLKYRVPEAGEARIMPPEWAVERALQVADAAIDGTRSMGIRVIGDLDALRAGPGDSPPDPPDPARIPTAIALAMAVGVARGAGVLRTARPTSADPGASVPRELVVARDRDLLRVLLGRQRRRAGLVVRAVLGRPTPGDS